VLNIKSLEIPEIDLLAITDKGDENTYEHVSLDFVGQHNGSHYDHISDIPSDFLNPLTSVIIHEEELGAPIVTEDEYVDRPFQTYRPYTAAEFKALSALINTEV
jgi:hypothetical protein